MHKPMIRMLVASGAVLGLMMAYQLFGHFMLKKYMGQRSALVTISAMPVDYTDWQPLLKVVATLSAVQGVELTTEVAGLIDSTPLRSGQLVEAGDLLVSLNSDADREQLLGLEATAELARISHVRDQEQFVHAAISQSALDAGIADLKNKEAAVSEQKALIAKKRIRAPFKGYLGVSPVNVGQFLNPGDAIATLQDLDKLHVNFYVPQNVVKQIDVGKKLRFSVDAYPGRWFEALVSAMDPKVDPKTRTRLVQATLENADHALLPGMFASAHIALDQPKRYLTLPQTAIAYNPYGETVFIIHEEGFDHDKKPILIAKQSFVTIAEQRGDQAAIAKGLSQGDKVVTSGAFKLKHGMHVCIDNSVLTENDPQPSVIDE
jgi:membrane fusion protein, multidrug efflux system